jgi:hypothetical protein
VRTIECGSFSGDTSTHLAHRVIDRLRVGTCPLGDQLQASHLPELAVRGAVEFVDQATGADQVLGWR